MRIVKIEVPVYRYAELNDKAKEVVKDHILSATRNAQGFTDSVNIANESYHYTNSKTLALEGIGEFLKKIWDSIVNGFKWIVNKFKNLFGFLN